ncbi:MAG TPA: DUF1003 domain-containing protein [Kiritimatiellia bacterium]|nr:DUF1003 domain-containing protein [Kiritimatiellia bacterium]HMP00296.1 DUF1003 domain-containing protein [Kiritimatiellia bacterium]HMP97635.1 DUF1003 domain-containing protein [Kiritimatiellia bacterium]
MLGHALKNIPLFAGLTEAETQALADVMERREFDENQTIFWAGDRGTEMFILESGRVDLFVQDEAGRETPLAMLRAGDYFGELSLLDGQSRTATCRAATRVRAFALKRNEFYSFLESKPKAALHVLETLGRRQRSTIEQLRGLRNPNDAIRETVEGGPLWPRIADRIAALSASRGFLLFHVVWFSLWTGYNTLAGSRAFDPYPFGLLTMTVSLEAIFLSIFVLVSANRQSERDRIRADVDHQVNLKAHHELLALHRKLDRLVPPTSEAGDAALDPGER